MHNDVAHFTPQYRVKSAMIRHIFSRKENPLPIKLFTLLKILEKDSVLYTYDVRLVTDDIKQEVSEQTYNCHHNICSAIPYSALRLARS